MFSCSSLVVFSRYTGFIPQFRNMASSTQVTIIRNKWWLKRMVSEGCQTFHKASRPSNSNVSHPVFIGTCLSISEEFVRGCASWRCSHLSQTEACWSWPSCCSPWVRPSMDRPHWLMTFPYHSSVLDWLVCHDVIHSNPPMLSTWICKLWSKVEAKRVAHGYEVLSRLSFLGT